VLRVGVFIDLYWGPGAGGHVKSWERFAEAATQLDEPIDLTLHMLGEKEETITLSEHVRFILLPPRFSTERLPFLKGVADHTDLASCNPRLLPYLEHYDVLQATHSLFTYGSTVKRYAQQNDRALLDSIHTDVPRYTRVFTTDIIQKLVGDNWLSRLLLEQFRIAQRAGDAKERKLEDYWRHCDAVFVSHQSDYEHVAQVMPVEKIHRLRRGINFNRFNPALRNREKLKNQYDVPTDRILLLYVGRLDAAKHVMTVARTIRVLLDRNLPVHGLFVGRGNCAEKIADLLGEDVTLTGVIEQEQLGYIYASADLLIFSSETETYGNVVVEAKACGTPVAVSNLGGPSQLIQKEGEDGVIIAGQDPQQWARVISGLIDQPDRLSEMGHHARQHMESAWPSWKQILEEDLIPVWKATARQHGWKA